MHIIKQASVFCRQEKIRHFFSVLVTAVVVFVLGSVLVSDVNSEQIIAKINIPGSVNPKAIDIANQYAYFGMSTNSSSEFYVINIATSTQSSIVGSLELGASVTDVAVFNNHAYLATQDDNREFIVVDITNKYNPSIIGSYDIPGSHNGLAVDVIDGYGSRTVYFGTTEKSGSDAEFYIFDVTNPTIITLLGSRDIGAAVNDIETVFGYSYVATSQKTQALKVLDVRNPTTIVERSSLGIVNDGGANALDYQDGFLYLVTNKGGVNPDFYVIQDDGAGLVHSVGSLTLDTINKSVAVRFGYAYVGTNVRRSGLTVVDVRNATSPTKQSITNAGAGVMGVAWYQNRIFAATADGAAEFKIINTGIATPPLGISDVTSDGKVTIGCLGDSNTLYAYSVSGEDFKWCEYMRDLFYEHGYTNVKIANIGWGGASAYFWGNLAWGQRITAAEQVHGIFDPEIRALFGIEYIPDAMIFAFGTNDVYGLSATTTVSAADVAMEIQADIDAAKVEVPNLRAYVARTPKRLDGQYTQQISDLNTAWEDHFGSASMIDFYDTNIVPDDFADTVHMNAQGQQKRGLAAFRKIIGQ